MDCHPSAATAFLSWLLSGSAVNDLTGSTEQSPGSLLPACLTTRSPVVSVGSSSSPASPAAAVFPTTSRAASEAARESVVGVDGGGGEEGGGGEVDIGWMGKGECGPPRDLIGILCCSVHVVDVAVGALMMLLLGRC